MPIPETIVPLAAAIVLLGSGKSLSCPETCDSCGASNFCYSCKQFFWNVTALCVPCPVNCPTGCDVTTGNCFWCTSGVYYGDDCSQPCSLCRGGSCNQRACTNGCKDGYFKDNYQGTDLCRECSSHCVNCTNYYRCTQCEGSYYLNRYFNQGQERSVCLQCYMIPPCEKCLDADTCLSCQSIPHCQQCKTYGFNYSCTLCENGYSLLHGQCVSSTTCNSNCLLGCNNNGACTYGCMDGYTGQFCNESCNALCQRCTQTDANYCEICKDNRYTRNCSAFCHTNCLKKEGLVTCRIEDSYCLNGCTASTWGDICQNNCSRHCNFNDSYTRICMRENGTCVNGCLSGYSGDTCATKMKYDISTTTEKSLEMSKSTKIAVTKTTLTVHNFQAKSEGPEIAVGAGVSAIVVILFGLALGIILLKRRRRREKQRTTEEHILQEDPTSLKIDSLYSKPVSKHRNRSYIYAQPNKIKKTSDVVVETNLGGGPSRNDDLNLEEVDDGEAIAVQNDFEVPTNDAYYNTEGLLRSRIENHDLLGYICRKKNFEEEFEKLPNGLTRTCTEALKPTNRRKNRYNGVYAYDATRVVLQSKEYINACCIEGYRDYEGYIACLGPTESAMTNFSVFWEMVWQENSQKIVMLTNLLEAKKVKCDQYWPESGATRTYGDVAVAANSETTFAEFVVRSLLIRKENEAREVTQFHYIAWPDKSVPETAASLLQFRDVVERNQKMTTGPLIVHCSAGIGRTGTYIAIDTMIKMGKEEKSVDIFGCVMALRGQRVNMVQNVKQYIFLHHCVVYALTCEPESLTASELAQSGTGSKLQDQFEKCTTLSKLLDMDKETAAVDANRKRKENRKGADIPGDRHRVRLSLRENHYINAVYVDGYQSTKHFIVAQTPMSNTVDDFLYMLYQENVQQIVCLDDKTSGDKTVAHYISMADKNATFGQLQLSRIKLDEHDAFSLTEIRISRIGNTQSDDRILKHYQVTGWRNEDLVPNDVSSFFHLISCVHKARNRKPGCIVVHCLDGASKSGMFVALSNMLEKLSIDQELSLINTVCQVQARRRSAIRHAEQLRFCHSCVKEYVETRDAKIYYNIL